MSAWYRTRRRVGRSANSRRTRASRRLGIPERREYGGGAATQSRWDAAGELPFQDDSELRRRVTAAARDGLPLFPVRRGLLDGDLVFGVSRRGTLGVFLTPRAFE